MSDHDVAARLATEAGKLLLDVRSELAEASQDERKAAGDKRSHDFLMEALAAERPGDAVLSEEGADSPVRLSAERVWIIDPLDGTREFSELGRDDWAVHVALWQSGVGAPPARSAGGRSDGTTGVASARIAEGHDVADDPVGDRLGGVRWRVCHRRHAGALAGTRRRIA